MTQTSGSSRRGTSWAGEDPGDTSVPGRLSRCTEQATRRRLPWERPQEAVPNSRRAERFSAAPVSPGPPRFGCHSNRTIPKCNPGGWAGDPTASAWVPGELRNRGQKQGQLPAGSKDSRFSPRPPGPEQPWGAERGTQGRCGTPRDSVRLLHVPFLQKDFGERSHAGCNPLALGSVNDEPPAPPQRQEDTRPSASAEGLRTEAARPPPACTLTPAGRQAVCACRARPSQPSL